MADEREARRADATRVWLEPHDPDWIRIAGEESARIAGALGDLAVAVHHMGSTSIPGFDGGRRHTPASAPERSRVRIARLTPDTIALSEAVEMSLSMPTPHRRSPSTCSSTYAAA